MHHKLPLEIEPYRAAHGGVILEGELPLDTMPRLTEQLLSDEGKVSVKMEFDLDEVGMPYMRGHFSCKVSLSCERCLEAMDVNLDVDCLLAMVISELKIEGLAEQYEPWLLESNEPVALSAIVEDELILSLPIIAKHESACLPYDIWLSEAEDNQAEEKTVSPFAVLSDLKKKK